MRWTAVERNGKTPAEAEGAVHRGGSSRNRAGLCAGALAFLLWMCAADARGQQEAASYSLRYKGREASTGYYSSEYEVMPRRQQPLVGVLGDRRGLPLYSPSAARVRVRSHLADAHWGVKYYRSKNCEDCHVREAKNLHTVRANLTCRQCHGGEPIASINHYYSPLNPIRRHAYVCAKCHQGAGASFATYEIHVPDPTQLRTERSFPELFYVFWIMIFIAAGTFLVFIPHTILWGIRELMANKEKPE